MMDKLAGVGQIRSGSGLLSLVGSESGSSFTGRIRIRSILAGRARIRSILTGRIRIQSIPTRRIRFRSILADRIRIRSILTGRIWIRSNLTGRIRIRSICTGRIRIRVIGLTSGSFRTLQPNLRHAVWYLPYFSSILRPTLFISNLGHFTVSSKLNYFSYFPLSNIFYILILGAGSYSFAFSCFTIIPS